ncbi:patatin-like phospholipase family protein [Chitinophaga horti]|uniref:Patatin-like phospholipase family protein n=1 Tax=Chitinophaga horti TaxID=2920382 RepID=A0ABY6J5U8_9BACT|nr:patatin-like phospholipase family protein [Chitinophaga horti]UYQ95060.1 patatin-like phospholipase family protein [Chitinophaga horti]
MTRSQSSTRPAMALSAFTDNADVKNVLQQLHQRFEDKSNPTPNMDKLIVSDTLDDQGNQYVHLVQEGGGVLGVALVGYTYILEQAGIRFMRLAGTSAGAINTAMMAVIGSKQEAKSEKVLRYLCSKDLFDFVDGHPFARKVIRKVITQEHYFKNVKKLITGTALALVALVLLNIICIGLKGVPAFAIIGKFSFVFTGLLVVSVLTGLMYFNMLLKRFKDRGFGVNPGKDFQDWVRDIMQEHGVQTVSDFIAKAGTPPPGMHLRNGGSLKDLGPDVTLITSDIVTQNKIEFPKMWDLFTTDEKTLHPAQFVRASMSIPIFFESSIIQDIPRDEAKIHKSWMKHLLTDPADIPSAVRFVDGGILSNFPINIFYNPKIEVPRLPTFGIDLDDVDPKDKEKSRQQTGDMGLGGYMGRMFNTIRYYYDKDFLLKNSLFKKGIGRIDVHEFNWLDFSISDEKKVALFVKGAQAAGQFLQSFDWEGYKADRREAFDKLNTVKPIQQTLTATL